MTADIALLAEAGVVVGTGHLVEALTLTADLENHGLRPLLVTTVEAPPGLLAGARIPIKTLSSLNSEVLGDTARQLVADGVKLAVTNVREISNEQVSAISRAGLRVVCIDEFGGRHLDCSVVINPSPIRSRHNYTSDTPGFRIYGGIEYLALSPQYTRLHSTPRHFAHGIQSVVVTLGGVDRTGATLRVARALQGWDSESERNIVLGAAFPWGGELEEIVAGSRGAWKIHRNLPCLADLLVTADVAISAGGNTLFEIACVGTPPLVLFEDAHEGENGRSFEEQGFGVCLGRGVEVPLDSIREALDRFEDPAVRRAQCEVGKRLVDGEGASRIRGILTELVDLDFPVAA